MEVTHINDLGNSTFLQVFSYLSPKECAIACLVDKQWRQLAQDDVLWHKHVRQVLAQEAPIQPDGNLCLTYRQAFCHWANQVSPLTPTVCRALQSWGRIKAWLSRHYVEVLDSLMPGVSNAEVAAAESALGCALPEQVLAIYKAHNGQLLKQDAQLDNKYAVTGAEERWAALQAAEQAKRERRARGSGSGAAGSTAAAAGGGSGGGDEDRDKEEDEDLHVPRSLFHGLFGGYAFYDHLVVTRLLPLSRAVWWTKHLKERGALVYNAARPCLVVAASFNFRKFFVVDLQDCSIHVSHHRSVIPAAPASEPCLFPAAEPSGPLPPSSASQDAAGQGAATATTTTTTTTGSTTTTTNVSSRARSSGSVMEWFEEYSRRLHQGWYVPQPLDQDYDASRGICLFPCVPPALTTAVTRGVCVSASSVFAAEVSQQGRNLFTYRIRMRLQPEEEQQAAIAAAALAQPAPGEAPSRLPYTVPVKQCQLMTRHWVIRDETNQQMDEVRGEGVIGKYPLLTCGGPEFSYQSCTHQSGPLGFMEGSFRFVEGSLVAKTGIEWDVMCPQFELKIPDFIF